MKSYSEKKFDNRLELDRIITTSLWSHFFDPPCMTGWLGSREVGVLDSGAEGPGFKSQTRCCRVTVLRKLFTSIVPLFTEQRNWQQPS